MIKIYKYNEVNENEIFLRDIKGLDTSAVVSEIIADVAKNGDSALYKYCERFDKATLSSLEVSEAEFDEAMNKVDDEFKEVIRRAAVNIEAFHRHQVRNSFVVTEENGVVKGQKVMPIEKVGLYVPGGTARYPSSVLMNAIPAKIAGVERVVMVSPPAKDGKVNPVILAAAKIAGVDRIFKIGGAQAVAALASGTETVPKVDKIVGPGNAFVAEAKKQVYGITFEQGRNELNIDRDFLSNMVTENTEFPDSAKIDLIIALITLKYTQSNSVCYAKNGQAIGIGAGQQSRVHCTRLAGQKADNWLLRQCPKVLNLPFLDTIGRADRDNAIDNYIGDEYMDVLAEGTWQNIFKVK